MIIPGKVRPLSRHLTPAHPQVSIIAQTTILPAGVLRPGAGGADLWAAQIKSSSTGLKSRGFGNYRVASSSLRLVTAEVP
jgi:hypothetical protein